MRKGRALRNYGQNQTTRAKEQRHHNKNEKSTHNNPKTNEAARTNQKFYTSPLGHENTRNGLHTPRRRGGTEVASQDSNYIFSVLERQQSGRRNSLGI